MNRAIYFVITVIILHLSLTITMCRNLAGPGGGDGDTDGDADGDADSYRELCEDACAYQIACEEQGDDDDDDDNSFDLEECVEDCVDSFEHMDEDEECFQCSSKKYFEYFDCGWTDMPDGYKFDNFDGKQPCTGASQEHGGRKTIHGLMVLSPAREGSNTFQDTQESLRTWARPEGSAWNGTEKTNPANIPIPAS